MQNSLSVTHRDARKCLVRICAQLRVCIAHCATNHIALCNVRATAVDGVELSVMGVGGTGEESLAARSSDWGGEDGAVTRVL